MTTQSTSNNLDTLVPKIAARGLLDFRQKAFMPQIVNADYSAEAAQKGDTISVLIPSEMRATDVTPGHEQTQAPHSTPKVADVKLDQWKSVRFYLTDKELLQIDADEHFLPFQMTQAISALATEVNKSFLNKVVDATAILGKTDAELFASNANNAINAQKILNANGAPKEGRYGIISFDVEAQALQLSQFSDASKSNDANVNIDGEIGRKFGINWISSDQLRMIRENDEGETFNPTSAVSKGATQIQIASVETPPVIGDAIIKTTDDDVIIIGIVKKILKNVGTNEFKIEITTPVPETLPIDAALSYAPAAPINLIFQRNAFAFATRPLAAATQNVALGNRIISLTDPLSGLSLRLEIYRQHKQTVWEIDVLWGVEMVRPELAIAAFSQ